METVEQAQPNPIARFFSDITTKKAILIISILGIIVFCNSLPNDFVIDDKPQIVDNPIAQSVSNVFQFISGSTFYNATTQLAGGYYKPLLNTFYSVIYTIIGPNEVAFHFFSLILHITSVILLFLVLTQFFKKPLALILSLVFLVHPINSEAVFYISDLQDVLFFFFGILALYKLIKAKSTGSIFLVSFLLFLSILSKETGVLFFPLVLLYAFIFNRKYLYQLLGILAFAGLIYLALRMNAIGIFSTPHNTPIAQLSLTERLWHIPAIIFFYFKTFFFPFSLSVSWHWIIKSPDLYNFYLPLLVDLFVLGLITFVGFKLHKNNSLTYFKSYLFFSLWLIIGLLLHLQIVPLDVTVADRWFYFPIVGALGIIGTTLQAYSINLNRKYIFTTIVVILLLFSTRTFARSFDWRDEYRLATHDVKISQDYALENMLSFALLKQGRIEEAKLHAEKSINLFPYFTNYNSLGSVYLVMGDYQKARETYFQALKFGDYYIVYENLAGLTIVSGTPDENIKFIEQAISKFPGNAKLWTYLAILEYKQNNTTKAKEAIARAFAYDQTQEIVTIYKIIMSGSPLELNIYTTPK